MGSGHETTDEFGARTDSFFNDAIALLLAAARGDDAEAARLAEVVAPGASITEALAEAEAIARATVETAEETA